MKNYILTIIISFFVSICFSQIHFEEIDINCLNLAKLEGGIIIRNDSEYQELYSYVSPHSSCDSYSLPKVDFTDQILIGLKAEATGCEKPKNKLVLSTEDQGCLIEFSISSSGMCKKLFIEQVWILVKSAECSKIRIKTNQKG